MKPRSSSLFATWSFLSLYAVAGLCTAAEHRLQPGAPSPDLAQHQARAEPRVQSSPSLPQPRALDLAPVQDEALSHSGPASRSQRRQVDPQHPGPKPNLARRRSAASRRTNTGICTFTAFQVQACVPGSLSELANYLQINTLYSPYKSDSEAENNVRHQRPFAEYNSYQKLLADDAWEVTSVGGDGRTLVITEGEEGDLRMSYGGAEWTEETRPEDNGAGWCEEAEWYEAEDWSCPHGETRAQRKRTIHCGFPCARIEQLELK